MDYPPLPQTDQLLTAVIGAGLSHQMVSVEDVISWADSEIEKRQDVPMWLIDLAMSKEKLSLDMISLLRPIAENFSGLDVCRGLYSLVPDPPAGYSYNQYGTLAGLLYRITYDLLLGDWDIDLLTESDIAGDNFGWIRDGCRGRVGDTFVRMSRGEVIDRFLVFLDQQRDPAIRQRLHPIQFILPTAIEQY